MKEKRCARSTSITVSKTNKQSQYVRAYFLFNFIFIYTKFISAFRQDICETSALNNWTENSVPSPSSQAVESATVENQSNNQR